MDQLEEHLRNEETELLQEKLRTNSYSDDAAAMVKVILAERGATVPTPETEEQAENAHRKSMRRSNTKFLVVVGWLISVWIFKLYEPEKHYAFLGSGLAIAAMLGLYKSR